MTDLFFSLFAWANEGDTLVKIPIEVVYGIIIFGLILLYHVLKVKARRF